MEIFQKDDGNNGMFYIEENHNILAKMTYVWYGKTKIIIDHTEVDDALSGKGAGKQMVAKAVSFARERGIKIIPQCPFARSVFDKVEEYKDVL
jgi:predicted GNAT family acetyltransferase